MQAYALLGGIELEAGRLAEARAWWKKFGELAKQLGDQRDLASVAQNLGIVCQKEGEAARARGEKSAARFHFDEALRSVAESLEIEQSLGNKPGEAASLGQLAPNLSPCRRPRRRRVSRSGGTKDLRVPRLERNLDGLRHPFANR